MRISCPNTHNRMAGGVDGLHPSLHYLEAVMSLLAIDIETFSDVDLPKCGVYAYSDSPLFQILLFAYAFDDEPTQVVDLACGEQLPDRVLAALEDETITKTAFNAAFERTCISRHLGRRLSPVGWQCTAVQSAMSSPVARYQTLSSPGFLLADVLCFSSGTFVCQDFL